MQEIPKYCSSCGRETKPIENADDLEQVNKALAAGLKVEIVCAKCASPDPIPGDCGTSEKGGV